MTTIESIQPDIDSAEMPEISDPLKAMVDEVDDRLQHFIATGETTAPDRRVPLLDIDGATLAAEPDLPEQFAAAYQERTIGSLARALNDLSHLEWVYHSDHRQTGQESLFRIAYFSTQGRVGWLRETYTGTGLRTPHAVKTGYNLRLEQAKVTGAL